MRKTTNIDLLAAVVYVMIPGAAAEIDKLLNIPPSDCSNCDHKRYKVDGHCYMFRNQPTGNCAQYKPIKSKDTGQSDKRLNT